MTNPTITLDAVTIQQMIDSAVEDKIISAVETLGNDPAWLAKIENMINQTVVQRTVSNISSIDIGSIINQRVDENMNGVHEKLLTSFSSSGIQDRASSTQLTVLDDTIVIENQLVSRNLEIVETAVIKDLVVKGTINTDNRSWSELTNAISQKTLSVITDTWRDELVTQVKELISKQGISFNDVQIDGQPLVSGNRLSAGVTESNLQTVGQLQDLTVKGEANIYNTLSVKNHRLGINTQTPEMALSIWDEEVSVVIGKNKSKQAFIGTNRDQGLAIGTNRLAHLEIDVDGLTRIKKLQIGLHQLGHSAVAPGWSGTKGDIVFNTNPGADRVFAWVCLGAFKWQTLKSAT